MTCRGLKRSAPLQACCASGWRAWKIANYAFGLINVTLFAIIFFQIQLYASLLLQIFFFAANVYGWYAWSRQTSDNQAELQIRWLPLPKASGWLAVCVVAIGLMTVFIDPVLRF
jgi:nicotinamide mononucleotide transporter